MNYNFDESSADQRKFNKKGRSKVFSAKITFKAQMPRLVLFAAAISVVVVVAAAYVCYVAASAVASIFAVAAVAFVAVVASYDSSLLAAIFFGLRK